MLNAVAQGPQASTRWPALRTTIVLGHQSICYADHGARDAERVLLLFNGIGAGIEIAATFAEAFENTRVITFDMPGVGASPAPCMPYRMSDVADLAAALLDHLGLERVDVFGVSWGGAVAQEFGLRHAKRCRTLTLAATCAGYVMVPGEPDVLLKMLSPRRWQDLLLLQGMLMGIRSVRGYLYQLLALSGWTRWHDLPRLQAPTLVLMGIDDPIMPPVNGRIIASRLPRATVETVDCGHLFMLTQPVALARRVERFMGEHALPA